ncbi:MAG: DUF4070 domain-containing protein, partial [Clostridiales bacterium]|nr:DUF4070 domain-containing protein [Clostridiales bacterium]
YSPKYYYQRVRRFLKEFKPISRKIKIPEFNELKALARSIIILGIGMKGRTYYWRLFFWSLFRQPKMFPMAITMSIYGFHFRRVFEKG